MIFYFYGNILEDLLQNLNKKEALAERIYEEMEARKAGLGLLGLKKNHVPEAA